MLLFYTFFKEGGDKPKKKGQRGISPIQWDRKDEASKKDGEAVGRAGSTGRDRDRGASREREKADKDKDAENDELDKGQLHVIIFLLFLVRKNTASERYSLETI